MQLPPLLALCNLRVLPHLTDTFSAPRQEYLNDYNDTLLAIYLASMTKGVSAANEIVDKYALAYEKSGRRRAGVM